MQTTMTLPAVLTEAIRPRELLDIPITCASLDETVSFVDYAIQARQNVQQVSMNVAKLVAMRTDTVLRDDVRSSDLVSVDGMGILWAGRLMGLRIPERVAGIDLMKAVLGLCERKAYKPYLLGARPAVLEQAVSNLRAAHPALTFAGWHHGYFNASHEPRVVDQIKSSGADCLFVGMPTPRKERFLARHRNDLKVPFIMGVGGSLDVFAGFVRRAPKTVQDLGLEWLFRTVQEPMRLGPRYLKTNTAFAGILAKALAKKYVTRK
jgi:N-acetylglucosaminyldiphosphoundecaprenol N-acetyl-beta-D-mannosaminyltransferase